MNMNKNFKYGIVSNFPSSICKGVIINVLPDGMKTLDIQEVDGKKTSGWASFHTLYNSYQEAENAILKGGVQ